MIASLRIAVALLVLAGCAGVAPPSPDPSPAPSIPTHVEKPPGSGPFPAIVMLHDCSGLGPRSSHAPARWAQVLVKQGYVVAMPDSFSTRGFPSGVCVDSSPARSSVGPLRRVADAYQTLAYLRTLPYVDSKRIGVMGGSHGGATTLATLANAQPDGFVAAVALYPSCRIWIERLKPAVPLLILTGELDDWTPAKPCLQLAENASRAGSPVSIKVYPGAHHSFDCANPIRYVEARVNENAPGARGATTGGNPEAWADSIREVTAFFARYLRNEAR